MEPEQSIIVENTILKLDGCFLLHIFEEKATTTHKFDFAVY